jgi:hypothetical protein
LSVWVSFKSVPWSDKVERVLGAIFSLAPAAPFRLFEGASVSSPSPSEPDFEDDVTDAFPSFSPLDL